jgi:hypothetical protein
VTGNPVSKQDGDGHLFVSIYHQSEVNGGGQALIENFLAVVGDQGQDDITNALQRDEQKQKNQQTAQDQQQNPPPPDANHTHTLVVRQVSGQDGNSFGHVTVQVDGGAEVGFGPVQNMTKEQVLENASVPGQVEPRAAGTTTTNAVTIYLTKDQAGNAQANINARTANPGNYQVDGRSCVDFGETVVHSTGARAPSDLRPAALIQDIRSYQIHDNSSQAP